MKYFTKNVFRITFLFIFTKTKINYELVNKLKNNPKISSD